MLSAIKESARDISTMPRTVAVASIVAVAALVSLVSGGLAVSVHGQQPPPASSSPGQEGTFRFRSGVELINVTATVSDGNGRFVAGPLPDPLFVVPASSP